jgi:hypothetical protein
MGKTQRTAEVSKAKGETRPRHQEEPQICGALDGRDAKCTAQIAAHDSLGRDIAELLA